MNDPSSEKDKPVFPATGTPSNSPSDPQQEEELAHYDDAVIGRAFRWSVVTLLFIGLAVAGVVFAIKYRSTPLASKVTQITPPTAPASARAEVPVTGFADITAAAGITFVHNNGAYGDKLLPETMGGGVAFLDYDGDGDQDLLFINYYECS